MPQSLDIRYRTRQEVEESAEGLRHRLGQADFPVDLVALAHELGLEISYVDFELDDIAGQLIRSGGRSEIRVRGSDPERRQAFTIAHEIGHFLLHPTDDGWSDTEATMYRLDYWGAGAFQDRGLMGEEAALRRAEVQANAFAAALLMPRQEVREWWNRLKSMDMILSKFGVSKAAMTRRLQELGLIVPSVEGFYYADLSPLVNIAPPAASPRLTDDRGPIPTFPPIALDEHGRIIPLAEQDLQDRQNALVRTLKAIDVRGRDDPPGLGEAIEDGIDEHRPHRKLFDDK